MIIQQNYGTLTVNGRRVKIEGTPVHGIIKIGLNKYQMSWGIIFDGNTIVKEIDIFGRAKDWLVLSSEYNPLLDVLQNLYNDEAKFKSLEITDSGFIETIEIDNKEVVVKYSDDILYLFHSSETIDWKISINQKKVVGTPWSMRTIIEVGPFVQEAIYIVSGKYNIMFIFKNKTPNYKLSKISTVVKNLLSLDERIHPLTGKKLFAKFDSNILVQGTTMSKVSNDTKIVLNKNCIYLTNKNNRLLATIFCSPLPIKKYCVRDSKIIIVISGARIIELSIQTTIDNFEKILSISKDIAKSKDIMEEFYTI